jgi:hypothetical protein
MRSRSPPVSRKRTIISTRSLQGPPNYGGIVVEPFFYSTLGELHLLHQHWDQGAWVAGTYFVANVDVDVELVKVHSKVCFVLRTDQEIALGKPRVHPHPPPFVLLRRQCPRPTEALTLVDCGLGCSFAVRFEIGRSILFKATENAPGDTHQPDLLHFLLLPPQRGLSSHLDLPKLLCSRETSNRCLFLSLVL